MLSGGKQVGRRTGFTLGRWTVLPDRNVIQGSGGRRTLEPMGMRLLLLLARRAPETVTRDEMIDALWQGRVVTDDAVNKQVSKLRAALACQSTGPSLVETVPKIGVRLTVSPSPLPAPLKVRTRPVPAMLLAGLLTATLYVVLFPATPQVSEEPLTALPGLEADPALSADGRWLAYVARAKTGEHLTLHIRSVDGNRLRRVSPTDSDAAAPAWGPHGALAFVARRGTDCRIYVRAPAGNVRIAAPCIAAEFGGLAWLGADRLIISDHAGVGKSFQLSLLEIATGRRRALAAPPNGDIGDSSPLLSRDGKTIYFLRSTTVGTSELYSLSITDNRVKRLSPNGGQISAFALGPGTSLIISAQRGTDGPALWQFRLASGRWLRLASGAASGLTSSADGRLLAFARIERQTVLWQLPLNLPGPGRPLTPSTRSDWSPVLSPNGRALAFLSNRSGSEEAWLLDVTSGETRQLTHFNGPKLQDLAWSADSNMLLTSAPNGGQFDIFLIDKRSGASKPVAATALDERHGAFSPDGRAVLFVRRSGSRFELRRFDFVSGSDTAVLPSVMRLIPTEMAGPFVFTRPFEGGVWVAGGRDGTPRKVVPFPDLTRMRDIVAVKNKVWTVQPDGKSTRLVSVDLQTGVQRPFRLLPDIARPSGIAIIGDTVVYARSLRVEADLFALRLKD